MEGLSTLKIRFFPFFKKKKEKKKKKKKPQPCTYTLKNYILQNLYYITGSKSPPMCTATTHTSKDHILQTPQ